MSRNSKLFAQYLQSKKDDHLGKNTNREYGFQPLRDGQQTKVEYRVIDTKAKDNIIEYVKIK